jgi:hypothetical protein
MAHTPVNLDELDVIPILGLSAGLRRGPDVAGDESAGPSREDDGAIAPGRELLDVAAMARARRHS